MRVWEQGNNTHGDKMVHDVVFVLILVAMIISPAVVALRANTAEEERGV